MPVDNEDMNQKTNDDVAGNINSEQGTTSTPKKKRGPGRPPKSKTATAAPKKKRGPGRPPKSKTATATSKKTRGPGRPPKSTTTAVSAKTKRSPGRPPKSLTASTATKTKRGRGRPPKSATTIMPSASTSVLERERTIKENFKAKLAEAKLEIANLKTELKTVEKREKALLKLFENREKAVAKFAEDWKTRELRKLERAVAPKKRRTSSRKKSK